MRQETELDRELAAGYGSGNGSGGNGAAVPISGAADPSVVAPTLLEVGRESLKEFHGLLEKNTATLSVDFVHDLRVATRRLGEVVSVVEALMDAPAAKAVSNALRQTRRSAGALRDLDVLEEHLHKWHFPAAVKGVKEEILAELPGKRDGLAGQLGEQLRGASLAGAEAVLAHVLEDKESATEESQKKLAGVLRKQMKRRRKQLREAFGKAAMKQTSKALHEARIRAKKLRYSLELADQTALEPCKGELKFLKRVQKDLGQMHDVDVIVVTLEGHMGNSEAIKSAHGRAAWRKWVREVQKKQGKRAGEFFVRSYLWMNRKV